MTEVEDESNIEAAKHRYFLEMAYDGSAYHGWQIQPNANSIQQQMNDALAKIFRGEQAYIVGAGRTDTGVHANYYVAHFNVAKPIDDVEHTLFKFNTILPPDIAVYSIQEVEPKMHARFSATSRTYHYSLTSTKSPFLSAFTYRPYFPLDYDNMNEAAALLTNYHDFSSFSKTGTQTKTNLCDIIHATWKEVQPGRWIFEIKANRFLRNMVRAIVGTLFDVGRGRLSTDDFKDIIESKDRRTAGTSAPACGLSLTDIQYPSAHGFERTIPSSSIL